MQRCDSLEDSNGVIIQSNAKIEPKPECIVERNGNQIRHSGITIGHRDNQALLNSVRSKVMSSSFSMEDERHGKKTKILSVSDMFQKLKKRMKYR